MTFLTQKNQKKKFFNIRKRVYDVMNIFIALKMVTKVKSIFYLRKTEIEGTSKKMNLGDPTLTKNDSLTFVPNHQYLIKMDVLVVLLEKVKKQSRLEGTKNF